MSPTLPPVISPAPRAAAEPPVIRSGSGFKAGYVVLIVALLLIGLTARAVAGYFFLGNQATALRKTVFAHAGGQCEKRFAVHLGWMTTGLVRYGTRLFKLPPEPRAALDTLRGLEVGVYRLPEPPSPNTAAQILADTDRTMAKRGWDRIVGVLHEDKTVAIYAPHQGLSRSSIECAVMVLHDRDLIIAAGSGNPLPLIELASGSVKKSMESKKTSPFLFPRRGAWGNL
jgi:hypothetical protein